jgi:hypothetical protein
MVDPDRFRVNDKTEPTQAKQAGQCDQEWRHLKKMNEAAHDSAGENPGAQGNPHG